MRVLPRLDSIDALVLDPNNARAHPDDNLDLLALSLQEVGAARSIVIDEDDMVMAGNATVEAARRIGMTKLRVVDAEGDELIAVRRAGLSPTLKSRLGLYDNRTAELALWKGPVLTALRDENPAALAGIISNENLAAILLALDSPDGEEDGDAIASDGSLLGLVDVVIGEPRHTVAANDVWDVGPHLLIVTSVLADWMVWRPYLEGENVLFCPYPGPFVPLTVKAERNRLVMVQPNHYLAGHLLDRYEDVHGADTVAIHAD